MKKILMLFTILGLLSFSGTKEDYEKAVEKYNKAQNIEMLVNDLKKITSNKSDEYVIISKFNLAEIYLRKKDIKEAKKYLLEIIEDNISTKEQKMEAYTALFRFEEKNELRIKYLESLVLLDSKNIELQVQQIAFYSFLKNEKKVDELYKNYTKNLNEDEKETFDFLLAEAFQEETLAINQYKKLLNAKDNEIRALSNFNLGRLLILENLEEAQKYFENASRITKKTDLLSYSERILSEIHLSKKEYDKAKEKAIKALSLEKNEKTYAINIVVAELTKDSKLLKKTIDDFKKELKSNSQLLNALISQLTLDYDLDISEKYAKIALSKDKIDRVNVILALISARKGNKKEALKYIEDAKKAKITLPNGLEEEINKMK